MEPRQRVIVARHDAVIVSELGRNPVSGLVTHSLRGIPPNRNPRVVGAGMWGDGRESFLRVGKLSTAGFRCATKRVLDRNPLALCLMGLWLN